MKLSEQQVHSSPCIQITGMRGLVSSALEPNGCKVLEAGSVDAALQICRGQRFDALFIDLKMPGRDGTELIRELLGEYSLNQMVVITANPDICQVAELLALGPITLVCKPLSVTQLVECVKRMTGTYLPVMPATAGSAFQRG